jgi:hypothetical protein
VFGLVVFSDYQIGVSKNMKHLGVYNFISVFGGHLNVLLLINGEQFYAYYLRVDGWMDGWILPIRKHNISLSLTLKELVL